jgi:hypothetical protein
MRTGDTRAAWLELRVHHRTVVVKTDVLDESWKEILVADVYPAIVVAAMSVMSA